MIQTFTITAPLGQHDPDAVTATLEAAGDKLVRLYPHLRHAATQATTAAATGAGILTITIRVAARDRWKCSAVARKIGTNMLLRAQIPADQGRIELVQTAPTARSLGGGGDDRLVQGSV